MKLAQSLVDLVYEKPKNQGRKEVRQLRSNLFESPMAYKDLMQLRPWKPKTPCYRSLRVQLREYRGIRETLVMGGLEKLTGIGQQRLTLGTGVGGYETMIRRLVIDGLPRRESSHMQN